MNVEKIDKKHYDQFLSQWLSSKQNDIQYLFDGIDLYCYNRQSLNTDKTTLKELSKRISPLFSNPPFNDRLSKNTINLFKRLEKFPFDVTQAVKIKALLSGFIEYQKKSDTFNGFLPIQISDNQKMYNLNINTDLLNKYNIDINSLLKNNNAKLNKTPYYVMDRNNFEKVSDFLHNLSIYKNINSAYNSSNIKSLGISNYNYANTLTRNRNLIKSKKIYVSSLHSNSTFKEKSKKYTIQVLNSSQESEYPDWLTAKSYSNMYKAIEANKQLKSAFSKTRIITPKDTELDGVTISKINSHNQLISDIKKTIVQGLLSGDSIFLKAREGVDYSVNTQTQKPFENIQQLYLQQLRMDKNYTKPYFMPLKTVRDTGFTIPPKNLAVALSSINKIQQQVEFTYYLNADQIRSTDKTLDISKMLIKSELNVPFLKSKEIPPEIPAYEPKSIALNELFAKHISQYFKSIYTGEPYNPPKYTKSEIRQLADYITRDNSTFFKDVLKAHKTIKDNLEKEYTNRRQNGKVRKL
jgi:hypothetical protein